MAFQPKSYRKFMVASASAALAASAVAPAASAAEAETAAEAFTDVTVETPHYDHINALYQEGVINGFEDGEFKRNQYVPRSQAAEMFFNALGLEEVEDTSDLTFTDVNERLAGEILALENADIVDGHSEVEFGYEEDLTREQAAKMIAEAFGVPQDVPEADFTDLMDTTLYKHISAVANAGIVDGYPDGSFGVGEPIKRGDFAKMFHNAWNYWMDNKEDTSVTVSEVGSVKSTLPGVFGVEIKADALEGATADTEVSLDVDGETVELTYDADRESFKNIQISGYTEEELNNAEVVYDSGDEDSEDSESTELGTVTDLEGSVKGTLPGVYGVELSVDNLDVEAGTDEVALVVDGEEVELSYDADRESYKNIQISGYSEAQLEAATVIVK